MTWMKGISKLGKYPKNAFKAILQAIYPAENSNGTKLLQLDFETGETIPIYGVGKAQITEDGVVVAGSLAKFQESLEALGYECLWGVEGDDIMGFRTEPDITGATLHMEPLPAKIGDDDQTSDNVFWGTVKKIETTKNTANESVTETKKPKSQKPGKYPDKPKPVESAPEINLKEHWENALATLAAKPVSAKEIRLGLKTVEPDGKIRQAMGDCQTEIFKALIEEGYLTEKDGKYQAAI